MALPFKHPFTGICAGPTGSGKSELMKKIVLNAKTLIEPPPQRIVWYYAEYQAKLNSELGGIGVEFREGCPDMSEFSGGERVLLIIDDLMSECGKEITNLFVKGSHHRNLSIWFLMQNFFHQGKEIRTITLNAQYIILFKNPRDKQQVKVLARQMFDRDAPALEEAFSVASSNPHGYLLVDLKQDTPDHLRLRSKIIPGEAMEIYASKKLFKGNHIQLTRRMPLNEGT
jgi:Adenovirus IVa2 protein